MFFLLLAIGAAAIAGGALAFGWWRAGPSVPASPFLTAFILFVFLNTGLAVGIWLLFDENVSKPIDKLAADLRIRSHAGVDQPLDAGPARYLGDLAPAAAALTDGAQSQVRQSAETVTRATERLLADRDALTELLSQIPIATILLNAELEIVLYDFQAAEVLGAHAPARLFAPITDYFDQGGIAAACLACIGVPVHTFELLATNHRSPLPARIMERRGGGYLMLIDPPKTSTLRDARPLIFDFDLMERTAPPELLDTPLNQLCCVVFDTETTGLSVTDDAIVQIGAVRVLRGDVVPGEEINTLVNPGRPIPPRATAIHGVSDADVTNAPSIKDAATRLHHFARGAVLVAHNAPFDMGLLQRCRSQTGLTWDHPVLDTVLISAVIFGTHEDHSLDALCARLCVDCAPESRHTALGDAQATAAALIKLLPIAQARGMTTFGALQAATQVQARRLYKRTS